MAAAEGDDLIVEIVEDGANSLDSAIDMDEGNGDGGNWPLIVIPDTDDDDDDAHHAPPPPPPNHDAPPLDDRHQDHGVLHLYEEGTVLRRELQADNTVTVVSIKTKTFTYHNGHQITKVGMYIGTDNEVFLQHTSLG
eukprot:scpid94998/ scgid21251/ 